MLIVIDGIPNYLFNKVGGLLGSGLRSHWRSFLQVETSLQNGSRSEGLTLYNVLIRNDDPETALFNEMEVQILDGDGRVFTTCESKTNFI